MNAVDIMMNGNKTVLRAVDGLDDSHWQTPGVCGEWSVKDIIAHLASFEVVLVEVLDHLVNDVDAMPTLNRFLESHATFNDDEVAKRRDKSAAQLMQEYKSSHDRAMALANRLPDGKWTEDGILPWYGEIYDLDDFVAYTFYGHKREHCAQIAIFRDQVAGTGDSQ